MARGRRCHHRRYRQDDRREGGHLRLRAPDGRSKGSVDDDLRRHPDPQPVVSEKSDTTVLAWARKVLAIAQNGLLFTQDVFERERYTQLKELADSILAAELDIPLGAARTLWNKEDGYATPKVDVRGGVFDGDKVLLVRERSDGKWT